MDVISGQLIIIHRLGSTLLIGKAVEIRQENWLAVCYLEYSLLCYMSMGEVTLGVRGYADADAKHGISSPSMQSFT